MRAFRVSTFLIAFALAACGSSDSGAPSASASARSTVSVAGSTPAPPGSPSTRAGTAPPSSASGPAPSGSSKFACGSEEDPCPMQKWMKDNVGRPLKMEEKDKVVAGFKTISEHAPPGYDDWKKIADEGAKKAATDLGAAGDVCKQCHTAYQEKYRAELRDKPWP